MNIRLVPAAELGRKERRVTLQDRDIRHDF
jgi:hypothetical protein